MPHPDPHRCGCHHPRGPHPPGGGWGGYLVVGDGGWKWWGGGGWNDPAKGLLVEREMML